MSYWIDNAMHPGTHTLIDLGCIDHRATRQRYDRLRKALGKKNFQIVGHARLVARVPPARKAAVLARFRSIKEGAAGYCWCTHGYASYGS